MMSNQPSQSGLPLSETELDALENALKQSLETADLAGETALPPLQIFQEARRQRHRLRPQAAFKPKDTYHHGNLRESLIAITMEQAEDKGIGQLSLRAIAKQAGVSAPALYRHFKDKEALLVAVAEKGFQELSAWLNFAAPPEMPFQQRLRRFFQAYLNFMVTYPLYFQLMFGAEIQQRQHYPELQAAHEAMMQPLVDLILSGRQAQYFNQQAPADEQVLHCWTSLHGFASLQVMGLLEADSQALLDALLNSMLQGLQA